MQREVIYPVAIAEQEKKDKDTKDGLTLRVLRVEDQENAELMTADYAAVKER